MIFDTVYAGKGGMGVITIFQAVLLVTAVINLFLTCYYAFQGFIIHRTIGKRGYLSLACSGGFLFSMAGFLAASGLFSNEIVLLLCRLQAAGGIILIPTWISASLLILYPGKPAPRFHMLAAIAFMLLVPTRFLLDSPVTVFSAHFPFRGISFLSGTPGPALYAFVILSCLGYLAALVGVLCASPGWKKRLLGISVFSPGIIAMAYALSVLNPVYYLPAVQMLTILFLMLMSMVLLFEDKKVFYSLHSSHVELEKTISEMEEQINTLNEEIIQNQILDPLTQLYNRKEFHDRIASELSRVGRHGRDLVLVYLDLDNFRFYNEEYGHYTGDFILKEFSDTLLNTTRKSDTCSRFGSDEFMLLLPETSIEGAVRVLENIWAVLGSRRGFSADISDLLHRKISVPEELWLDFCAGIVVMTSASASVAPEALVGRAREALADARKKGGGNYSVYRLDDGSGH